MSNADLLSVRNWGKFQHYKDRSPPWIKIYRTLLRDYDFSRLSDSSKLLLLELWLLAAESDGRIPNDPKWVKKQIPFDGKVDFKPLIDSGYLVMEQDASNMIADCKQNDTRSVSVSSLNIYWSENNLKDEYTAFKKMRVQTRKPINDVAADRLIAKHKKLVADGHDPAEIINLATERCWASFFPPKKDSVEKVPISVKDIQKLVIEKNITLPDNCTPFDARRVIADETGMRL